jgi:hypothetical protein
MDETLAEQEGSFIDTEKVKTDIQLASLMWPAENITQSASAAASVAAPPPPAWTAEEEKWAMHKQARKGNPKAEAKAEGKGSPFSEPNPEAAAEAAGAKAEGKGSPFSEPNPEAEAKFVCDGCKAHIKKMVDFKVSTWDGTYLDSAFGGVLRGTCFSCSGIEDPGEFKKAAKASHADLASAMSKRNTRVRDVVFKQSMSKVQLQFPHLSRTKQRELAVKRVEAMVLCIGASLAKMKPAVKEAFVASTVQYLKDIEARAEDPTKVAGHGLTSISYTDSTWLTQVAEGCWVSWVCRRKTCRWLGRNDMWIKHSTKEWYRCPHCGHQYRPFVQDSELLDGQKAVTTINPLTQEVVTFLAKWPTHEEDSWLARAVEMKAKEINAPSQENLEEFLASTAVNLGDLLAKVSVPATWRTFAWRSDVEFMLDTRTYSKVNWERLQAGYVGDILPLGEASEQPFAEWEQLISCLARSLVGFQAKTGQK